MIRHGREILYAWENWPEDLEKDVAEAKQRIYDFNSKIGEEIIVGIRDAYEKGV